MEQLTAAQCDLLDDPTARLVGVDGLRAIVLGGSHARGRPRPESDLAGDLYTARCTLRDH